MGRLDTSSWTFVGRSTTGTYYLIEPRIVIGVGHVGARDNAETARENTDLHHALFRQHGPGVLLFSVDEIKDQNAAARRIYRDETDPKLVFGVSVIVGSLLARAIGSFYLGLARPRMPFKLTASVDEALIWARRMLPPDGAKGR